MPNLNFTTWDGVVVGTEIWSETYVSGQTSNVTISTDAFGNVSGQGGGGNIVSSVQSFRRIYFKRDDNGEEFCIICNGFFGVVTGHRLKIHGCKLESNNSNFYSAFFCKNENTGDQTWVAGPANFISGKNPEFLPNAIILIPTFLIGYFIHRNQHPAYPNIEAFAIILMFGSVLFLLIQGVRAFLYNSDFNALKTQMSDYINRSA